MKSAESTRKTEVMKQLQAEFPAAANVVIEYFGGADSFGEFSSIKITTVEGLRPRDLPKNWRKVALEVTSSYMFSLLDYAEVSFNSDGEHDGSDGVFIFDLLKSTVTLTTYSYIRDMLGGSGGDEEDMNGDFERVLDGNYVF